MKKYLFLIGIIMYLSSCDSNNESQSIGKPVNHDGNPAYQEHYLDVDFDKVNTQLKSGKLSDEEKKVKVSMVYSAFRRAHEHTEIQDGLFQLNVESGKEIGISPTLFKIIKATLDETNEGILKAREQNPDRKINGKADGVVDRKHWDWDLCMGLYEKYGK